MATNLCSTLDRTLNSRPNSILSPTLPRVRRKQFEFVNARSEAQSLESTERQRLIRERLKLISSLWYFLRPSYRVRVLEINEMLNSDISSRLLQKEQAQRLLDKSVAILSESESVLRSLDGKDS